MFTPLTSFSISLTILVQTMVPGILGGIVKGLKGGKPSQTDVTKSAASNFGNLEDIFFKPPFPDPLPTVDIADNKVELDIGLHFSLTWCFLGFISLNCQKKKPQNILYFCTDDIEIDEPNPPITKSSTSSPDVKNKQKGKSLSKHASYFNYKD